MPKRGWLDHTGQALAASARMLLELVVVGCRLQDLSGELEPDVAGQRIRDHCFEISFKNPHPVSREARAFPGEVQWHSCRALRII